MKFSESALATVKEGNPIADVLRERGVALIGSGKEQRAQRCPAKEHTRKDAVSVNVESGEWHCHVCNTGGDVIAWLQQADTLSFPQAVQRLAERAGVELNNNGNAPLSRRASPPAQPVKTDKETPDQAETWHKCVAAFTDDHAAKLATWRGYSPEFIGWLRERELVGLHNGKIAFPVHGDAGKVLAIHFRIPPAKEGDRATWAYWPKGVGGRVLEIGDAAQVETVAAFESQWDLLAVADKLGLHRKGGVPGWAFVATRGADNAKLLAGLASKGATVFAFAQNDTAGRLWLQSVADHAGVTVKHVATPEPHKDAADWCKAGATLADLDTAATGGALVQPKLEAAATPCEKDWPEPAPLPEDLPPVPAFNFNCLPDNLRPWLEDIAERMQCPPDFPAVAATVALGSIIGRKIGIRPKKYDDWLIVVNLWGAIVGRPGLMKTPACEQALLPLRRLVAEALKEYEAKLSNHKADSLLQAQRRKLAERKIAEHLKAGDESAARVEAKASARADDSEPKLRRYEVNDSTVAKLGELLAENPNGLLVHRDELIGLLRGLDKEGNEESRAFYLESWNGTGSFTFDRIGRGTIRVESNTLAILGGIQPDLLTSYVREAVRGGAA